MSLTLSPEILARAYDYLQATKPFCNWNLPDSDDVRFKVVRTKNYWARYVLYHGGEPRHTIEVSKAFPEFNTTDGVLQCVAHEMVHLHQKATGMWKRRGLIGHNRAFILLAKQVCKEHGWDEKLF